jgi:hypothetical protein
MAAFVFVSPIFAGHRRRLVMENRVGAGSMHKSSGVSAHFAGNRALRVSRMPSARAASVSKREQRMLNRPDDSAINTTEGK